MKFAITAVCVLPLVLCVEAAFAHPATSPYSYPLPPPYIAPKYPTYTTPVPAVHYVRSHYARTGTYIPGHNQTNPDGNFSNNWSSKGNSNPYTGANGTKVGPGRGAHDQGTGSTWVSGYTLTDGTYVPGYFRSNPSSIRVQQPLVTPLYSSPNTVIAPTLSPTPNYNAGQPLEEPPAISPAGTASPSAPDTGTVVLTNPFAKRQDLPVMTTLPETSRTTEPPIVHLAKVGDTDAVNQLIRLGVPVDTVNSDGDTPLLAACMFGHVETLRFLLKSGANVFQRSSLLSMTPLMLFCYNYSHANSDDTKRGILILLSFGSSIDDRDANGETALMIASESGNMAAVKVLIGKGANLKLRSVWGYTALQGAILLHNLAIAKLLIAYGAPG